jgi:AraC family transcriptional regulator of adaptative response / DNA-3-methyladenine glycosylase II
VELDDREFCYRVLQARDRRYDGLLFVGVTSTGIYCRPICPARTAKFENTRFFRTAAAAEEAGFRACLRCRPEISPQFACWRGTSNTVSRALGMISAGFLDKEGSSVDALAERVGIGERQLRRLFEQHLGAAPLSVAQTRRVLFAKQLLHETQLPMTDVAFAAGFGSVRRFNETFRTLYGRAPSDLRRLPKRAQSGLPAFITLHAAYQPPYDWSAMLRYLEARAIDGVEGVENGWYRRTFRHEDKDGLVEVANNALRHGLTVRIRFASVRALPDIMLRIRRVFDLGADLHQITSHLMRDQVMAKCVAVHPGLRAPGGWDSFELAVRAVLGQQITVAAARLLGAKLVRICDNRVGDSGDAKFLYVFPDARSVADADLSSLGMPVSRKNTLQALAKAALATPDLFDPAASLEESIARLRAVPGIGEWTAQYIALRALRESDAFPATDAAILRGAAKLEGTALSSTEILARAEAWRPWRGYAAQHLWAWNTTENGVTTNHL